MRVASPHGLESLPGSGVVLGWWVGLSSSMLDALCCVLLLWCFGEAHELSGNTVSGGDGE